MRIRVVAFGKQKAPGLTQTAEHYLKLLKPWVKIEIIVLKPTTIDDKRNRDLIRSKDERLFWNACETGKTLLLDESAKAWSSREWSTQLKIWSERSTPSLTIGIGPSLGWSDEAKLKADALVSFGPQTHSHELMRVVLLEQVYRAYSIWKGHPYHND